MKRITRVIACVLALALIGTTAAFAGTIDTVDAVYSNGTLTVSGTTEDTDILAAVVVVRNAGGKDVAMQSCSVYNGAYSTTFTGLKLSVGRYTACVADFEGGTWATKSFSVSSSYAGDSAPAAPVYTGTWNAPVTDGTWKQLADGSWTYSTNAMFCNTWGYIRNPYAKQGQAQDGWFYFDGKGKMLTGWQLINGKWYFLNTANDGTLGMCLLNTTTPDGYKVDANGAWIR